MFRFKQFSVLNSGSAFKVGTDAVLLGIVCGLEVCLVEFHAQFLAETVNKSLIPVRFLPTQMEIAVCGFAVVA